MILKVIRNSDNTANVSKVVFDIQCPDLTLLPMHEIGKLILNELVGDFVNGDERYQEFTLILSK